VCNSLFFKPRFFYNSIGNNGAKYLGKGILKCVTLTFLNLNLERNRFDENGAKYLVRKFSKCVTLTSLNLNLNNNSISDNGANYLGEGISKCSTHFFKSRFFM